jgi:hypothetical protein
MGDPESSYRDVRIVRREHELVLIYFGASTCGPCVDPEFKAALRRLKTVVADIARSEHRTFRSIGVSIDWELELGLSFLNDSGPWNEVIVGNNWYNSAAIEHFWNQQDSMPALPQVLLLERSFAVTAKRRFPGPKNYLVRLVGRHEVEKWIADAVARTDVR